MTEIAMLLIGVFSSNFTTEWKSVRLLENDSEKEYFFFKSNTLTTINPLHKSHLFGLIPTMLVDGAVEFLVTILANRVVLERGLGLLM